MDGISDKKLCDHMTGDPHDTAEWDNSPTNGNRYDTKYNFNFSENSTDFEALDKFKNRPDNDRISILAILDYFKECKKQFPTVSKKKMNTLQKFILDKYVNSGATKGYINQSEFEKISKKMSEIIKDSNRIQSPISSDIVEKYNLDTTFYHRAIDASGIPIIATDGVSDDEMRDAQIRILEILKNNPKIKAELINQNLRIILNSQKMGEPYSLPEFPNQTVPGFYANDPNDFPVLVISTKVPQFDILLHELAHAVDISGLRKMYPEFAGEILSIYNSEKTKFKGAYAETNEFEFFASIVQIYHSTRNDNGDDIVLGDGTRINKEKLKTFSPASYGIVEKYFP